MTNNTNDVLSEPEIQANKKLIDDTIINFLPKTHSIQEIDLLYNMMRDYPLRPAKGIRSSICLFTCQAFGGQVNDALLTASSLELFQNWILIHDDIEDESELRRGQPVLHRKHTIPLAINAGDSLHGRMWSLLQNNHSVLGADLTLNIIEEFINMLNETTEGQHMELSWSNTNDWDISQDDYFIMCTKKTSWYTCITPFRLGNMIANKHTIDENKFVEFGTNLGIAFQIRDDILNLTADGKYGKEYAGDLIEGKRTLILIHLLKSCNNSDREFIESFFNNNREFREGNCQQLLDLISKYKSLDYATNICNELSDKALTEFNNIFSDLPETRARLLLNNITKYMVSRNW
jgi:geranylgeranyl diphosphate synthase type II|tara:strand:+ start:2913 stop:3956 length:1044 start_codon:yes stop_codon:yes gene_type:complete